MNTKIDTARPLADLLVENDACNEARKWARKFLTAADAWASCKRPDWMLWALRKIGVIGDERFRSFACWCIRHTPLIDGRLVWDLLVDQRSRAAVDLAERVAAGQHVSESATEEAYSEAMAVIGIMSSRTSKTAARVAAYSVGLAATLGLATSAVSTIEDIAKWDAACGSAGNEAIDVAVTAALAVQSNAIRAIFGNPFAITLPPVPIKETLTWI